MVNSSYKQHVQVVGSPKATPVFVNGAGAGHINLGTGNIGTPQAARPAYLQYIPAPTSYGTRTGAMVGQLAEQINKTTLELADFEAKNSSTLASSGMRQNLHQFAYEGADGRGGILTKKGTKFIKLRHAAELQMHDMIMAGAEGMGDNEKSYYLATMQKHFKVLKSQIESKYLIEAADVNTQANHKAQSDSMANALALSHKPREAMAFVYENYKQKVLAKHLLTEEDLKNGATDTEAMNASALEFAKGLIATPGNSTRLEPYLHTINKLLTPKGQKTLIKLLQADTDLKLKNLKDSNDLRDEKASETWQMMGPAIGKALVKASQDGTLTETVQKLKDINIVRPQGLFLTKKIEAMHKVLKLSTDTVPPLKTTSWLARQAANGTPPMDLALAAETAKVPLDARSTKQYVVDYESKLLANTNGVFKNLKTQLTGYVENSKGITPGKEGYFLTTPAGKAWVAMIMEDSDERIKTAYRDGEGGVKGLSAAHKEATQILKEVQTGQWNDAMVTVTKNLADAIPQKYSAIAVMFPSTDDTAALPELFSNQSTNIVFNYLNSMSTDDISGLKNVKIRKAINTALHNSNFFEARANFDGTYDPGLSAIEFFKSIKLLQIQSDPNLSMRTKVHYMHNVIDQTDIIKSRYSSDVGPEVTVPDYLKKDSGATEVPTSEPTTRFGQVLHSITSSLGN